MISLNIASPYGDSVKKEVKEVQIKAVEGNVTILENHIPFISLIKDGYVKYEDEEIQIKEGVMHFKNNNLYITYLD